ncbi:MAG: DUF1549 domain-containing protein [Verrucomicrobiae bacterium]|nr:DUF1549 domain-containing protein [Verrucomicrobiae bacterium]
MSDVTSPNPSAVPTPSANSENRRWQGWLCIGAIVVGFAMVANWLWRPNSRPAPHHFHPENQELSGVRESARIVDDAFANHWEKETISPAPPADDLTIARRLSLALTGTIPSLEEVRSIEAQPENHRVQWWLSRLLEDPRSSDYVAERLARAYVGVENGPFLVYRRRRLVRWISEQLQSHRPYDEMVRELISAEGLWTTNPAANFITATIEQNDKKEGPDQIQLAIRTTRAFLGVRIDCVQCHDDKFGDRWKQEDFHQLAAFYSEAEMKLTGVRDDRKKHHEVQFRGDSETSTVSPVVPFAPELMPAQGSHREQLAAWTTHPENRAFARTAVNRVWAILYGQPLVSPIDDIPLDPAQLPPGMELLAEDFITHDFDIARLIRVIAESRPYQLDSRSHDPEQPITEAQEKNWAAFPLTRLRPEQVANSVVQASYLDTIDEAAPFLIQLAKFGQQQDFVKRYGDLGEGEFDEQSGTIPQRLLLMNGKLVKERTDNNPVINAVTRINSLAPDPKTAVEAAYLCLFTRRPTKVESAHFVQLLSNQGKNARHRVMEDLYWSLLNATEFSWNH